MKAPDTPHALPHNAGVIAPPPLIALAALLIGIAISHFYPTDYLASISASLRYIIGGTLVVGSFALLLIAAGLFKRIGTSVKPWKPSTALVTTGLYRFTRNPMYVGFLGLSFGIAFLFARDGVMLTTLVLWAVLHFGVIKREEAYLAKVFGDDYEAFKAKTPRYGLFL